MGATVFPVDAVSGAPSYTGRMLRQVLSVLAGGGSSARPLAGRTGVNPRTPSSTVAATSSAWTVHAFGGYIDAETSASAGGYLYSFDTDVTGSMTAANATNPRIDLISVQISDPAESDGSSTPSAVIVYTTGTAAPSPNAPATPARAMALAQINVPVSGGGSPSVSWVARYTAASGGIVPTSGSALYPSAPYVGQYIDDASLGLLRWDGSGWNRPLAAPDILVNDVNTSGVSVAGDSTWHAVPGWSLVSGTPTVGFTYSGGVWTKTADGVTRYCDVFGKIAFTSNATGQRGVRVRYNGTIVWEFTKDSSASSNTHLPFHWWGQIGPGDTIELDAFVSSGAGSQALVTVPGACLITIRPAVG